MSFARSLIHSLKLFSHSCSSLFYPEICLHCRKDLGANGTILFCRDCQAACQLLDPIEHCLLCFAPLEATPSRRTACAACKQYFSCLTAKAAAFPYAGPAASLVKSIKYQGQFYLAEGAAALLTAQYCHLDWPMPEIITYVPSPTLRQLERGFNHSQLLAQAVAKNLNCPCRELLARQHGSFSQANLNRKQREALNSRHFYRKTDIDIRDKVILLIDDVTTTSRTLESCAKLLAAGFPKSIYALTLCQTIE